MLENLQCYAHFQYDLLTSSMQIGERAFGNFSKLLTILENHIVDGCTIYGS